MIGQDCGVRGDGLVLSFADARSVTIGDKRFAKERLRSMSVYLLVPIDLAADSLGESQPGKRAGDGFSLMCLQTSEKMRRQTRLGFAPFFL